MSLQISKNKKLLAGFILLLITVFVFPQAETQENSKLRLKALEKIAEVEKEIKEKKYLFTVGYTKALERKLSGINIAGYEESNEFRFPDFNKEDIVSFDAIKQDLKSNATPGTSFCDPASSRFDLRHQSGIQLNPIRDQIDCGSCWAFAGLACIEHYAKFAFGIREDFDFSEQYLVSCNPYGKGCGGGNENTFNFLKSPGIVLEKDYPYTSGWTKDNGPCNATGPFLYQLVMNYISLGDWVYPKYWHYPQGMEQIKYFLSKGYMVFTSIYTGPKNDYSWDMYKSGIYSRNLSGQTNHALVIVGWDDNYKDSGKGVWIVRNSYGADWGEEGYGYILYGVSGIGTMSVATRGVIPITGTFRGGFSYPSTTLRLESSDKIEIYKTDVSKSFSTLFAVQYPFDKEPFLSTKRYEIIGIPPGTYLLKYIFKNHRERWYNNKNSENDAEVVTLTLGNVIELADQELLDGGSIDGRVTDESGNGVPYVEVNLHRINEGNAITYTDLNGCYSIEALYPGDYTVFFNPDGVGNGNLLLEYFNNKPDYSQADHIYCAPGTTLSGINAILETGAGISGRVTNIAGNGLPNIKVSFYNSGGYPIKTRYSDGSGYYSCQGLYPGSYKVGFESSESYVGEYFNNKYNYASADSVTVQKNSIIQNINVQLAKGGSISGTIKSINGENCNEITSIQVFDLSGATIENLQRTNGNYGNYSVKGLLPGNYKIRFVPNWLYAPNWYSGKDTFETADVITIIAGADTPEVNSILEKGGGISGRVTDSLGNGISGVRVYCGTGHVFDFGGVSTDANGEYLINGLGEDFYHLKFEPGSSLNYIKEYYNNRSSVKIADDIWVSHGNVTPDINAVLNQGGTISGRVVDQDGTPIKDICISVFNTEFNFLSHGWTNSNGEYSITGIPGGAVKVYFDPFSCTSGTYFSQWYSLKETFADADIVWVTVGDITPDIDTIMTFGSTLIGKVTAQSGSGIEGVKVVVFNGTDGEVITDTLTDPDGNFIATNLLSGQYKVKFETDFCMGNYIDEYYNDKKTLQAADAINLSERDTITCNAQISTGGMISGKVTNHTGQGIEHISVRVLDSHGEVVGHSDSNAFGNYLVKGLPTGNYKVVFDPYMANYWYSGNYVSQFYENKYSAEDATIVSVTVGSTVAGINASLSVGGKITGIVTNANGTGIENIDVYAYQYVSDYSGYWSAGYPATTNSAGMYSIRGLRTGGCKVGFNSGSSSHFQSQYTSEWYNDKIDSQQADLVDIIAGSTTSGINAALDHPGILTGRVTNSIGVAVASARIEIFSSNDADHCLEAVYTDSNGDFSRSLAKGSYKIHFEQTQNEFGEWYDNRASFTAADAVSIVPDQTTTINAELSLGGRISGRLTDSGSNGIANVSVEVWDGNYRWCGSSSSNSNGEYTVSRLNSGSYRVFFNTKNVNYQPQWYNAKDTFSSADPVAVIADQETTGIDGTLFTGGSIAGRVTDGSGDGVVGVYVRAYDADLERGVYRSSSTDADGYYEIIGLPGGDYRVSFDAYGINYWPEDYGLSGDFNFKNEWFNDQDKFPAADTVAVFPGQQTAEVNAVLTPGGAIRGTMLGYNSYPFVFCAFENNNWRDNFGYDRYAINGDWPYGENIYMIKGLPTGSYYVLFDSDVSFIPDAYYNNVQFIDDATKVAVTAGSITDNINMMSFPCGRLQGKITNAAGSGIANVGINFIDAATNRNGRSAVTDANGDYVRTNWSGNWKIYFDTSNVTQGQYESGYYNGKSSLDAADSLNVAPGADITGIDAVLEPGGGMISGFVYNSEGIGVANAAVELYQAQSKCWLAFKATQATGYYEFAGLIPGEYKIEVIPRNQEAVEWYSDKGSYAEATPVVAVQGQNTSCSITLGMTDPLVQSLTLVSPHGGESLIIGSTYEITWNDVGVDTLALLTLCQEGKAAQIIAMVDPLAKSYTWTVGTYSGGIAEKGGGYYIKIETADALFSSTSDGTFYLENSALTLNTPNGGESWELGTTQSISWLQSGLTGDITIDLYKAGSFYRRIGTAAVEAGSYSWTIPTDLTAASDFSVKIYQGSVEDMSNEYFSLAGQVVDPGDSVRDDIVGKMIYISAGSFSQGSPAAEVGRETDESQFVHRLSRNLWVMETEISRAMWSELKDLQPSLPDDPSDLNYGTGLTNPVQQVTWQQAVLFANLLSVQNGLARCYFTDAAFTTPIDASNYSGGPFYCNFNATGYRLPTEGEWEYFARAGTNTPFSITEPNYNITTSESCTQGALTSLENAAWFCANAGSQTLAVGTKSVNPWNLHDVHGNVWEWCWDYFGSYPTSSQTDYAGAPTGTERALRGGGFGNYSKTARSAKRSSEKETTGEWAVGFRLVRSIPKINSYLNVTSPNGASFWEKGKTYSITWLTQGGQNANVKIYLYKGTSTLVKTITTLTANDGSYDWLVPTALVTGSTYFIRVKTADNLFWDDSDKFSIIVPSISVIAPAAGTIWTHNATKTITWNKIGTQHANVKIQLYQGLTKKLDITLSTDNDGFYDWTVPATLAKVSTYSIRITTLDGKVIGKSGKFTITNGYIRVTAPVTGAKWIRGTSQAITWQYEGAAVNANVKIQLYKGIVKVLDISLSSPTASGTFTWDIPAELALATNYAVQVTALDNLVTGKTGNFAIVPGIITVTQPAAGTIWQRGLAHTITWSNEGTLNANVKVQLLKGTLVVATMAATTSNDGSFDWTIPAAQALAATYKVRITTVDGLVKGESGVFTISSSVGLTLLSPNGGEILEPNETKAIRWSDDPDVLEVKLEFSRDNGGSFTTIADHVPDTGSYDWLVPVNFTRNGIVRVSDSSGKLWRENSLLEYSFKFIYNGTGEEPGAVFWFGGSDPQAPGYGFARIEIGSAKVQFGGIAKTIEPLAADWHELRVRFDFRRDTVEIHLDDQMLFANAALNTTREHYFQPYLVLQSGGEAPLDFTLDDLAVNVVQLDSVGEDRQLFNVLCENFDRYDKRVNGLQNCWHWQNTKDSETKVELKIENLSDKSMRMLTEGGKQLMIYLPFLLPDKVPFDISDKNMVIENQ